MIIYSSNYHSSVGVLYLASSDKGLVHINLLSEEDFNLRINKLFPEAEVRKDDAKNQDVIQQLTEYFNKSREKFNLSLDLVGTDFQKKVWAALCKMPFGTTASYKKIAETIGNPKAVRAVGLANNRNPIPIIIPCHRIIGANGKLIGYGGGLALKKKLLIHEGSLHL